MGDGDAVMSRVNYRLPMTVDPETCRRCSGRNRQLTSPPRQKSTSLARFHAWIHSALEGNARNSGNHASWLTRCNWIIRWLLSCGHTKATHVSDHVLCSGVEVEFGKQQVPRLQICKSHPVSQAFELFQQERKTLRRSIDFTEKVQRKWK